MSLEPSVPVSNLSFCFSILSVDISQGLCLRYNFEFSIDNRSTSVHSYLIFSSLLSNFTELKGLFVNVSNQRTLDTKRQKWKSNCLFRFVILISWFERTNVVLLQTFHSIISQSFLIAFSQGYNQIVQYLKLVLLICDLDTFIVKKGVATSGFAWLALWKKDHENFTGITVGPPTTFFPFLHMEQ